MSNYSAIPQELVDFLRSEKTIFIKTDNYVVAHITANEGLKIGNEWSDARMKEYLIKECELNYNKLSNGQTINIYFGDAKYHQWIRHYQVKLMVTNEYLWTLIK
jgi:hypothetical protein